MSSARPCKFGFACRRADCWFSHPEGRQIDGAKAAPAAAAAPPQAQYVVNANAQNFKPPPQQHQQQQYYGGAAGAAGGYYQQQPMHGMAPHQMAPANSQAAAGAYRSVTRPLTPHAQQEAAAAAAAAAASSGVAMLSDGKKVCKFGRDCHRKDCYFSHPEGREIDDSPHSSSASTPKQFVKKAGARAATDTPSEYDLEDDDDALDDTTVDALVTAKEWFPAYKDCTCCKGYIHDCEEPTCASLGTCANCAYGKDDDGAGAGADEPWKDEWFGAARGCKCCEGFVYRCKAQQPACKAQGKCFCQFAAPAAAPAAAAAAGGAAGAGAPGGPPA